MIKLTTMDNKIIIINVNLIEKVESVPETVITLNSGKKVIVKESMDEVINKSVQFHKSVLKGLYSADEVSKNE